MTQRKVVHRYESAIAADIANAFICNLDVRDHDLALDACRAFRAGNMHKLGQSLSGLDPHTVVEDRSRFLARRQFISFFAKQEMKSGGKERRASALQRWHNDEAACGRTNSKLRLIRKRWRNLERGRPLLAKVLDLATEHCGRLLGPCDTRAIIDLSRPGPGVTQGTVDTGLTSPYYKMFETEQTCSAGLTPYIQALLEGSAWGECLADGMTCEVVDTSRHTLVPKNWKTSRSIAIEPSFNTWLQLGVHEHLASRLERVGNSIRDQKRNGMMARLGSLRGGSATIDLASASDTISYELVKLLVEGRHPNSNPHGSDWFALLCDLRCGTMLVDGTPHELEKFSSMGNGYTFVLETIIFLSLARACADVSSGDIGPSAYGDDLICGWQSALLLTEVLQFCGFTVNSEKSFYFGSFRESCGFDWYEGLYCTPLYLRSEKGRVMTHHLNQLYNDAGLDDGFDWAPVKGLIESRLYRNKALRWVFGDVPPTAGLQSAYMYRAVYSADTPFVRMQRVWEFRPKRDKTLLMDDPVYVTALLLKNGEGIRDGARRREGTWSLRRVPVLGNYTGPLERKQRGDGGSA